MFRPQTGYAASAALNDVDLVGKPSGSAACEEDMVVFRRLCRTTFLSPKARERDFQVASFYSEYGLVKENHVFSLKTEPSSAIVTMFVRCLIGLLEIRCLVCQVDQP